MSESTDRRTLKAETVRNFWRRRYKAEEAAEALALPLQKVTAIYEAMDSWKKSLRGRRGSVQKTPEVESIREVVA